jgi:hypothetical protein
VVWDFEAEALQQDCLVFGGCGQHDIDQRDLLQLGEDLARLVAKAGTMAPRCFARG